MFVCLDAFRFRLDRQFKQLNPINKQATHCNGAETNIHTTTISKGSAPFHLSSLSHTVSRLSVMRTASFVCVDCSPCGLCLQQQQPQLHLHTREQANSNNNSNLSSSSLNSSSSLGALSGGSTASWPHRSETQQLTCVPHCRQFPLTCVLPIWGVEGERRRGRRAYFLLFPFFFVFVVVLLIFISVSESIEVVVFVRINNTQHTDT